MACQMNVALGALIEAVGRKEQEITSEQIEKVLKIYQMRGQCLDMAIDAFAGNGADGIVAAARTFEAYLDGSSDTPAPEPRMGEK